jgi:DNA-binding MarR family transcriptional regulator
MPAMARAAPSPGTTVREAIRQTRPFRSSAQEAAVALLLTAEAVRGAYHDLLAAQGDLTLQQYNVLRILRGAGPDGLPTLAIADRMVERAPGITRMIDRLERKRLVTRTRTTADRRQVLCRITRRGLDLLARLDAPVDGLDERVVAPLSPNQIRQLVRLLDRVRNGLD